MEHRVKLRMTGRQQAALLHHLFPGDGREAVALALCGVGTLPDHDTLHQVICVHRIVPIPYDECLLRTDKVVSWSTDVVPGLAAEASRKGLVFLKIHSHPTGFAVFSDLDDISDRELFTGLAGWLDTNFPGISAIMTPDGRVTARVILGNGNFAPVAATSVAGSDINIWTDKATEHKVTELNHRTAQTFGSGTTNLVARLRVGVVGVSGTGSPVAEMLHRLGVGELVLVDDDVVEVKNLGRIYNSTMTDAVSARPKVYVQATAMKSVGLGTRVSPIPKDLYHPEVVRHLAQCDVIFGCMDSVDGRDLLNRLCVFYSIPYFDLGVQISADGKGGVTQVAGTVHYLQPDGSSLLGRGVYSDDQVRASAMRRTQPEEYSEQVRSKYILGVQEDRPAVISVNTLVASYAVNDFLARIHPFRDDDNADIATLRVSLTQTRLLTEREGAPCPILSKHVGRGDLAPLLNMPILSERRE